MKLTSLVLLGSVLVTTAACSEGEDLHCDEAGEKCVDESTMFEQAYDEGQEPGKEDGSDCSGVRVPDRSGFNRKIALTFDDGPNPATTPKVIEVLKAHRAPATFFINGSRLGVAGAPALAARIAADPDYILANHSQSHLDLATLPIARVRTEIDRTNTAIVTAGETPKYFRFPFGSSTCASKTEAENRGMIVTGWHIDSADWCFAKDSGVCKESTFRHVPNNLRSDMGAYVMSQVRSTGGGILLFHDVHANTANSLDQILTSLENAGYTFVALDSVATFPRLHGQAPAPQSFIGDLCMTDAQCRFTAPGGAGRCHPAGFCTVACAGSCPDLPGRAATFCAADTGTTNGICMTKAAAQNRQCASLPRTTKLEVDRFVGGSGATAARATVCRPN
jgi:peptidoglycan-N-acetylglucosamine deacetylase